MVPQVNRNAETWKGFDPKDLSMKEGCLFVCLFCFVLFVLMRSTEPGCFRLCSWSLWKALEEEEGCIGLVSWHLDLWCRSS
jgi:hypothetical protein